MTHKHKCNQCGHVWRHSDSCAGNTEAHTCKCGRRIWFPYYGGEVAADPAVLCHFPIPDSDIAMARIRVRYMLELFILEALIEDIEQEAMR